MMQGQIAHRDVEGPVLERQRRCVAANERDVGVAGVTLARQPHQRFIIIQTGNREGFSAPARRRRNGYWNIRHARTDVEEGTRLEIAQPETNDGGSPEAPVDQRDIPETFLQFAGRIDRPVDQFERRRAPSDVQH